MCPSQGIRLFSLSMHIMHPVNLFITIYFVCYSYPCSWATAWQIKWRYFDIERTVRCQCHFLEGHRIWCGQGIECIWYRNCKGSSRLQMSVSIQAWRSWCPNHLLAGLLPLLPHFITVAYWMNASAVFLLTINTLWKETKPPLHHNVIWSCV